MYMPDSGNVSFRLVFPPLDGRDTSFDFMEGGKDGGFIKGVNLKGEREGKLHCRLTGTVEKRRRRAASCCTVTGWMRG